MANREKRLVKGIDSLEKQIVFHKEKLKEAETANMEELVRYYKKEIANLKKRKENRENILKKE